MARDVERAESLSMAFLLILEALSPVERAVFLLREVFDYDYGEIAGIVEKTEDNCQNGHLGDLIQLLAADAAFYGDGGGKATAVAHPVQGRDRVARLLHGLFAKGKAAGLRMQRVEVNGQPGAKIFDPHDRLISVVALDVFDGAVTAVRFVVNPDKLHHLGPVSDLLRAPRSF